MQLKLYIAGISAVLALGAGAVDNTPRLEMFTTDQVLNDFGGTQAIVMSRNGRYIGGATYTGPGFFYDVETGKLNVFDGSAGSWYGNRGLYSGVGAIADNGRFLGTGGVLGMDGSMQILQSPPSRYGYRQTTSLSADGSIVTGMVGTNWTALEPCYWENGVFHLLPWPNAAQFGGLQPGQKIHGCRANDISADGSVIVGYFIAYPNTNPMIIWERQEDGSYEYVRVWDNMYEPTHQLVYDYDEGGYHLERGPNPYCWFEPFKITADGKTIAMKIQQNTDKQVPPTQLGFYNVAERKLELVPYDPLDLFGQEQTFIVCGVADDLTTTGIAGDLNLGTTPFIRYPGGTPLRLTAAFPNIPELWEYQAINEGGMPYLATGCSSDARIIMGYLTDIFTYPINGSPDEPTGTDLGFLAFYIDTGVGADIEDPEPEPEPEPEDPEDSGVNGIYDDGTQAVYYTTDGRRVENPSRGLYIRVTPAGATKVVIP